VCAPIPPIVLLACRAVAALITLGTGTCINYDVLIFEILEIYTHAGLGEGTLEGWGQLILRPEPRQRPDDPPAGAVTA
jgi:hypothetical protein